MKCNFEAMLAGGRLVLSVHPGITGAIAQSGYDLILLEKEYVNGASLKKNPRQFAREEFQMVHA